MNYYLLTDAPADAPPPFPSHPGPAMPNPPVFRNLLLPLVRGLAVLFLGGVSAAAAITLELPVQALHPGEEVLLLAHRADGQAPRWSWRILDSGPGTVCRQEDLGMVHYLAPETTEPVAIRLEARDLNHPGESGQGTVRVEPWPLLGVQCDPATLVSGASCPLQILKAGAPHAVSLEALSATLRGKDSLGYALELPVARAAFSADPDGRLRFTAPHVDQDTRCRIDVSEPEGTPGSCWVWLQPRLRILFDEDRQEVMAGASRRIRIRRQDGLDGAVRLTLAEGETAGAIQAEPGAEAFRYTAPEVAEPRTFHLRAEDPLRPGEASVLPVHVLPRVPGLGPEYDVIFERLVPAVAGSGWLTQRPAVRHFAGSFGRYAWAEGSPHFPLSDVTALVYVDDPQLAPLGLDRHWLAGSLDGLLRLSLDHPQPVTLGGGIGAVQALAVRAPATPQLNPIPLVLALEQVPTPHHEGVEAGDAEDEDPWNPGSYLACLGVDGQLRFLAGWPYHSPHEPYFNDGPAPWARFGTIVGLAMSEHGWIFVADRGDDLIRMITPWGQVMTLAGSRVGPLRDGVGLAAKFGYLAGLAYDPVRKVLYVSDRAGIRWVGLDGQVHLLIGSPQASPSLGPPPVLAPGRQFVESPRHLAVRGDNLFIAENRGPAALSVFNLVDRTLRTLVGHDGPEVRLGPVSLFAPDLHPGACASLPGLDCFDISPGGVCLVDLPMGLAQVDLGNLDCQPHAAAPAAASPGAAWVLAVPAVPAASASAPVPPALAAGASATSPPAPSAHAVAPPAPVSGGAAQPKREREAVTDDPDLPAPKRERREDPPAGPPPGR